VSNHELLCTFVTSFDSAEIIEIDQDLFEFSQIYAATFLWTLAEV